MRNSEALLVGFDQEMENTRKLLEVVPDGQMEWRPHPKSFTLGRMAGHVAEMPSWPAWVIGKDEKRIEMKDGKPEGNQYFAASRAEAVARFEGLAKEARVLIGNASDEELQGSWSFVFAGRTVFTMPRAEVLRIMFLNHLIHHRGQLGVYLRLLDVAIPGMYGPSADTGRQMMEQLLAGKA